jgi:hypothetical protein
MDFQFLKRTNIFQAIFRGKRIEDSKLEDGIDNQNFTVVPDEEF